MFMRTPAVVALAYSQSLFRILSQIFDIREIRTVGIYTEGEEYNEEAGVC